MAGKFELYTDKAGEYRFRLKAGNGEIILASEGYKQKASALNGIDSVKKNSAVDERYERKDSASGKPMFNLLLQLLEAGRLTDPKAMFNLKATNGQVIGTSETYSSSSARDNGIASVMKNAPEATVEDMTTA